MHILAKKCTVHIASFYGSREHTHTDTHTRTLTQPHTHKHTLRFLFIYACPAAANHFAQNGDFQCLLCHIIIIFYLTRLRLNAPFTIHPSRPQHCSLSRCVKHAEWIYKER